MDKQHTPGPWTVGHSAHGQDCVWVGGAVEGASDMGPDETWIDCNTAGNARLIAAAPDLLAALQRAHMALLGYLPAHRNDITDAAIQAAREAIAKATGAPAGAVPAQSV